MIDIAQLGLKVRSDGVVVATGHLDKMTDASKKADAAAAKLSKRMESVGQGMQKAGRLMTAAITLPLLALGVGAVRSFAKFDDAMTQSLAIMGDVSEAMEKDMADAARQMAKETVFSASQAAESYFFLASAGLDAEQSIAALPQVARFAQAGMFDMAQATDLATDAQSALGLTVDDSIENLENLTHVTDVLVKANTIANASVAQFSESLTNKAGSAMRQLNIEIESGVAVLAAWADQGVKGAEAGERFNIVTRDLQTAYRKNTEEFQRFNISVFDAQGNFRNMSDIVGEIEDALGTMTVEQQGATLSLLGFQDRSIQAIRSLIGMSDKIAEYEANLRDAGGTTKEVAEKQLTSFNAQMGLLSSRINDVAISLGEELAPHIQELLDSSDSLLARIERWAKAFSEADKSTQRMIISIAATTAVAGPLLIVLGSITRALTTLSPLIVRLGSVLVTLGASAVTTTQAISKFGLGLVALNVQAAISTSRLLAFAGPIGVAVGAVALLIPRLLEAADNSKTLAGAIDLSSDAADRFAVAIEKATTVAELDDELEEIRNAATLLERELLKIDEELSVFPDHPDTQSNPLFQQLIEGKERVSSALIALQDDYNNLRGKQRELVLGSEEEAAALAEVASQASTVSAALAFDSEAFAELKDQIDPAAKATRELAAARKLLDQAFAQGKIDADEFGRLNILLDLTLDNMTKLAQVDPGVLAELEENFAFLDNLSEIESNLNGLIRTIDPATAALKDMADARVLLNEAFEAGIIDEAEFDRLSDALDKFAKTMGEAGDTFGDTVALVQLTADTLSRSAEDGSDSQKAFALATELANTALAIQAVLNQGSGDPYSAFARMAAMAAIVASLGQSIGSFGRGSFANLSQTRQATQGTGSVLGDTEAKTESILRASEITADATSELVGINRGMLHALQSLQQGIEGAVVQLARGSGQVDFGGLPSTGILDDLLFGTGVFDVLGLNFVGDFLKDLLGGSADLVDEGIEILGGSLDEIFIRAFQSVEVKKHIFDDTDLEESFQDLDESVQQQFQLVFDSITDTVRQAAIALGIPLDVIDERIQSFIVESQRISLKDLDADEQREELLAVFGRIFDDLAAHVVPFIDQFQKVGEGLGETLVRVATSVQVFQEAVMQLGFAADMSDPEAVAQMAVGLVELTGGVSEFISQFTTFMDKFASDEQKLAFVTDQLNRAFEQAGLTVPATADGMWALMQSLDATTEEGREQIATLLRLADVAAEYYDLVESAEEERLRQAQVFRDQVQLVTDFIGTGPSSALRDLVNRFEQAMASARSLGASTREYAMILRAFDRQLQRMAAELTLRIISLTQQLFGSQMQQGMVEPISAGVEETRLIANSLFTDWQRALSNLREFTQSILLNEALTTLTPAERLAEAQAQFDALLQAAMGGDVEAAEALPGAAQELLEVARFMFASGKQYQDIFNMVLSALEGIDIPANIPEFIEDSFGGGTGLAPPPLTPLDLVAQALERVLLAMDLAEALRDLALVLDTSVIKLAKELGIPLNELVELLGVELGNLTDQTASALASAAELLGADVFELAEAVGISIEELAIASGVHLDDMSQALVTELRNFADQLGVSVLDLADKLGVSVDAMAETFGISIDNFEAAHFSALVDFSDAIGLSITEVTETLGISLGNIADATSTLSQALDMAIAELPDAIQADLGPMLDAIRHATTQADANLAIQQIGNYILGLPPDIAASLMPFLELIGFQAQTPELTALQQIEANTRAIVDAIAQIGNINITIPTIPGFSGGGGGAAGGPAPKVVPPSWVVDPSAPGGGYWKSFQEGGWVDQTGLYQLHAGEAVVNPRADNLIVVQPESDESTRKLLERISNEISELRVITNSYQQNDLQNTKEIASGVRQQAEQARRSNTRCG